MRRACLFVCLFVCLTARAQVTGNIIDNQGQTWAYASVSFRLLNPSGQKPVIITTGAAVPIPPPITATSSGTFSQVLTQNNQIAPFGTQWIAMICPFNPNEKCQSMPAFSYTSGSLSISGIISVNLVPFDIGNPFLFPLSHNGSTGRSALNGSAYYDVVTSSLYVRNPATGSYTAIGGAAATVTLNNILPATAPSVLDGSMFPITVQGTPAAPTAGSPAATTAFISFSAQVGQGTSGTTGQTAATGGTVAITGGNGGTAPAGSTTGAGGLLSLSGGAAGGGGGTAGAHGDVRIQQAGGNTYVGGSLNTNSFIFAPTGIITNTKNFQVLSVPLCTIPATPQTGCTVTVTLNPARTTNVYRAFCSVYAPLNNVILDGNGAYTPTSFVQSLINVTSNAVNPGDGQVMCLVIGAD